MGERREGRLQLSRHPSLSSQLTNRTLVYAPDGVETTKSYLSKGQRVMVWANGSNAIRVNING